MNSVDKYVQEIVISMTHSARVRHWYAQGNKYRFSRNWYQAKFDLQDYKEVDKWCEEKFGPHPDYPNELSRWWHRFEDSILFRDEKDYILFMLRWS